MGGLFQVIRGIAITDEKKQIVDKKEKKLSFIFKVMLQGALIHRTMFNSPTLILTSQSLLTFLLVNFNH